MERLPDEPRLSIRVEETEAEAWASLAKVTYPEIRLQVQRLRGATLLMAPGRGGVQFQNVFGLGIAQACDRGTLPRLMETYASHNVSTFAVHLCPTARPATLRRWLLDAGFKLAGRSALIVRRTDNLEEPTPFHRIRAATPADADAIRRIIVESGVGSTEWSSLIVNLTEQPDWRIYLALEDSRPVSMGGLFLHGEFAWQAPIWTLPEARNRGAQSDLIGHGLTQAAQLGADWVTTSWRAMPRHRPRNFERHGFQLLYMRSTYQYSAEPDDAANHTRSDS